MFVKKIKNYHILFKLYGFALAIMICFNKKKTPRHTGLPKVDETVKN